MKKQIIVSLIPAVFVFILFACNNNSEKKESNTIQPTTPEIKSVFVNGDSLHYIDIGKGDPVVFIHGTLDDYRVWQMEMDTFSKDHRVIAYSRRYAYPNKQVFNDSADYTVTVHARDLEEFIKSLNLGPVHLVGHSYGAYTALLTTLAHPELVKTLTLGEPPVIPLLQNVPGGDTVVNSFMSRSLIPAANAFRSGNPEKGISVFIGGVIGDTGFYSKMPPEVQKMMMTNVLELRGAVLSKNPFPPLNCDDLKKINIPVLLISGEMTAPLFKAVTDELNKCLPKKEKAVLPHATHGLEIENPGDFNRIVLGFIDKHSGK
ncbi:MAG TPA: alpha/beta hydrolase [Chitinophagaceae bacterium]|nr:alpha/beta hydrolase [Chitinophagaceae bacterium]